MMTRYFFTLFNLFNIERGMGLLSLFISWFKNMLVRFCYYGFNKVLYIMAYPCGYIT